MTAAPENPGSAAPPRRDLTRLRRVFLFVVGVLLVFCVAVLAIVVGLGVWSRGERSILIGQVTSEYIAVIAVGAFFLLAGVGLSLIPASRWWLLFFIPARILAFLAAALTAFAWLLTSGSTVVSLASAGCETGYVVEEQSFLLAGWGTVYRQDGLVVTSVARTGGDDGYRPFLRGSYKVVEDGVWLHVWYNNGSSTDRQSVDTTRMPALTLPARTDLPAASCEPVAAPDPAPPSPTPTPPAALSLRNAEESLRDMAGRSLVVAVQPVLDASGASIDLDAAQPVSVDCEEGGARLTRSLDFITGDNGRSLEQILALWDGAGYLPDRAMQQDIRYSETLPIERMSIRDTTTIDGLLHLVITTRCGIVDAG